MRHVVLREPPRPHFIILFPALGLPAIANDGAIDVIALVKKDSSLLKGAPAEGPENRETVKQRIVESLRYVAWSKKDEPYDSVKTRIKPEGIEDLMWVSVKAESTKLPDGGTLRASRIEFDDPIHRLTLRISDLVLKKFDPIYETTKVLRFHIRLADGEGLYNLVTLFDESSFVRGILNGLTSPGKHKTDTSGKILRNEDIRVYHPFLITSKKLLSIAHATDVHVSTRWESYERVAENIVGKGVYNNYNARFKDILEDINKRAGADLVVLTGDLIDYNRGLQGKEYLFNRNWILFYELLVENYEKPVFTLLGNHEYLLNPYPSVIDFRVIAAKFPLLGFPLNRAMGYLWNISTTEGPFAADMNLTGGEVEKLDEVLHRQISFLDAKKLMDLRKVEAREKKPKENSARSELKAMISSIASDEVKNPDRGIWYTCEEAVLWYFLVINPFKDYAFSHREMVFLMVDWNVGQDEGTLLLLPSPTNCLSPEQMKMVDELGSRRARFRIFCSHAPVLSPWPELGNFYLTKARKKWNHDQTGEYPFLEHDSPKFDWGALEETSRKKLIDKILSFPIHLCLTGHSHANRVFQIEKAAGGKKLVFMRREVKEEEAPEYIDTKVIQFSDGIWDSKSPVMLVTTSGGPIGRTSEVSEWDDLTPPGYRVINFDHMGKISTKLVNLKVSIRPEVTQAAVRNDPGSMVLRYHDIKRVETFSSSLPSSKIPSDRSVLIDEISGTGSTINKLDDGRAIVVKKIPWGATLTINDNDGTIVVQRNEGRLVINDNDDIINVDENLGWIIINQNDDTIIIHENGVRNRSLLSGHVMINSNGTGSPGDDVVRIYDNFGTVSINKDPDGNDDIVAVRRNSGMFNVKYNNDTVEIGINSGFVNITENTGGLKDSEIFIFKNQRTVSFRGNEGNIYVFDNSAGTLDIIANSDTIEVNSSKAGNITGARSGTVTRASESDIRDTFKKRERDQQPSYE